MTDSLLIPCPHCAALNRIPATRLHDHGTCGRCKKAPLEGHLGGADRNQLRSTRRAQRPAPASGLLGPPGAGRAELRHPHFLLQPKPWSPSFGLGKLDTEEFGELAARFAIRSIPTLVLIHRGKELPGNLAPWAAPT